MPALNAQEGFVELTPSEQREMDYLHAVPWRNSIFISASLGGVPTQTNAYPVYGFDFGFHAGPFISFGLFATELAHDSEIGSFLMLKIPHYKLDRFTPYAALKACSTFSIFGYSDKMRFITGGVSYKLAPFLFLRGESGLRIFHNHYSFVNGHYGLNSFKNLFINVSLEINTRGFFRMKPKPASKTKN